MGTARSESAESKTKAQAESSVAGNGEERAAKSQEVGALQFDRYGGAAGQVTHLVSIHFEEQCIARPFGVFCTCGFTGSCIDSDEAERVKLKHLEKQELAAVNQSRVPL